MVPQNPILLRLQIKYPLLQIHSSGNGMVTLLFMKSLIRKKQEGGRMVSGKLTENGLLIKRLVLKKVGIFVSFAPSRNGSNFPNPEDGRNMQESTAKSRKRTFPYDGQEAEVLFPFEGSENPTNFKYENTYWLFINQRGPSRISSIFDDCFL